jgi:transposase
MGHPAGRTRDFAALEARRLEAVTLLRQDMAQADVARALGVHRQSVSRWARQVAQGGRHALKHPGRAGRKPRLTTVDLRRLERALKRGPAAFGYATPLWTAERVAALIAQECGVHYHPGHVWRILRRLGWSCQRPTGRALERDEQAIRHWKKVRWPQLKKTPPAKDKRSSSSTRGA